MVVVAVMVVVVVVVVRGEELSQNPGINKKNGEIRWNATKPKAKDSDSLQFANEI